MAEGRDLSQELFSGGGGQDLTQELFPTPETAHARVLRMARDYMQWLPGGELLQAAPVLPEQRPIPAPELAPPLTGGAMSAALTRGTLPAIGEYAGSMVPGWRPVTAAIGAGAGELVEQVLHGEAVSFPKVGAEIGLSLLPEAVESTLRGLARTYLRSTPGGQRIRYDEMARMARENLPGVFEPPSRAMVDAAYQQLRQSGVPVDFSGDLGLSVFQMSQGRFDDLLTEIRRIDRRLKSGGSYETAFQRMRQGDSVNATVGELDRLRSELRKRRADLESFEARQLVRDLQDDIDESIDNALVLAGAQGPGADAARQARRLYARYRAAEEMTEAVESKITSTPDLSMVSFNLRGFWDEIRRNLSTRSRRLNRALDMTPGARENFYREADRISQLASTIELPMADVSRARRLWVIAQLGGWISDIMLSPRGRELVSQSVLRGRPPFSANTVADLANIARRDLWGSGAFPTLADEDQRRPGGSPATPAPAQ